ncbi:hypothetical protein QTL97_11270 [Sporosarcina thermotolerans]|uniref:ABC transporter permease n=1 Tax=Sporosarcina thermotolerans TaxID=633404 RepID=A0AAW9AA88_9BACL|nr:hypothetical protein [Sporosarcina thermotolerans]MDW0117518.1 hypothetical protein [Sporosarcina thermotolerans]WHT49683.1 hypothetical protein QNH10_09425 [Sporosarcina thermotolerans]
MNINSGTFRIVYEDARFAFAQLLILYITIPILLVWLTVGYFFNLGEEVIAAISGPTYFFIMLFAVNSFKTIFPVAIGMGSTRTNLLKTFYAIGLASVLVVTFILNVFQWILLTFYERWNVAAHILHPGTFLHREYTFLSYFLMDFMVGIFLFSFAFLFYAIYHRLGLKRSVIWMTVLIIVSTLLQYSGLINFSFWKWVVAQDLSDSAIFFFVVTISLIALLITYPIMRNAPLAVRSKK